MDYKTTLVLEEVRKERVRQEQLVMDGKFPFNCSDPERLNIEKFPVLGEEFGEVSKEVYELLIGPGSKENLRTELIQLAAVATAWAEALTPD
jgi:hypothetical protein